ncbi:MAG: glycosyltransferase family 39 protein [Chloroflexi bacterium]|nr:glycosyltransferase family 39 protein [Chloroflexota bacterium]
MLTTERAVTMPAVDAPDPSRRMAWLPLLLLVLITLGAAAVRLRLLMDVPSFTDETDEVLLGLAIARGERLPLVNDDAYIGALFNYLVAGLALVGGPSAVAPRVLVLIAGVATVPLTYVLGREIAGRWAGLLAAGLLATSGLHIVVNSRVAWSHALTPLFTTAALVGLLMALHRRSGWLLVLTGLACGLAVQTHPSAVALLPAVAGATLLHRQGRAWLRSPWPYLATLAAIAGCWNLLLYNLVLNPGEALRQADWYDYAYRPKASLGEYLAALPQYSVDLIRAHGSVYGTRTTLTAYLVNPAFLVTGALLAAGLALAVARRQWLLPLTFLSAAALLPFFGRQFGFLPGDVARYLSYLLPAGYALMAAAAVAAAAGALALSRRWLPDRWHAPARIGSVALAVAAGLALVWFPLRGTLAFEDTFPRRHETALTNAVVDAAVAARVSPVFIDESFNQRLLFGGGHLQHSFMYLLDLRGEAHRSLRVPPTNAADELRGLLVPGSVAIINEENVAVLAPLGLEPLFVVTGPMRGSERGYGLYRVTG